MGWDQERLAGGERRAAEGNPECPEMSGIVRNCPGFVPACPRDDAFGAPPAAFWRFQERGRPGDKFFIRRMNENDLQKGQIFATTNLRIVLMLVLARRAQVKEKPMICMPIDDSQMLCWLRSQLKVLSAWREELVCRNETDLEAVTRLEQHHQWLNAELERLDPGIRHHG